MKKLQCLLPIALCAVIGIFGVACVPDGLEAHTYSARWTSNINMHWHRCLDAGCNARNEYEAHDWVVKEVYDAPTCGDVGYGQYECSVCKATLGNKATPATIPATGEHDYKLDTLDVLPTCGEDGYGTYICSVCYDYAALPIPATGEHDFSGAYKSNEEGHYHVCLNECGAEEEISPHRRNTGTRFEPSGTQDGRIEYRCKDCNYLLESTPIPNPNVLSRFEVTFNRGSEEIKPKLGSDGEYYVTLQSSSNAAGGYTLTYTGYAATGSIVSVPKVTLYYYNEYTAEKTALDLQHSGDANTGYLGFIADGFYISRPTNDVSLWMECTPAGRQTISLKVHIKAT